MGLLVAMLDDESQDDLRANENLVVYKGRLFENNAAKALGKAGYPLYYYKRKDSTLEEDYFLRSASSLIPVEIKARTGRSKTMHNCRSSASRCKSSASRTWFSCSGCAGFCYAEMVVL